MNISSEASDEMSTSWIQLPSVTVWDERASMMTWMMVPATRMKAKTDMSVQRFPFRSICTNKVINRQLTMMRQIAQPIMARTDTGKSGACITTSVYLYIQR